MKKYNKSEIFKRAWNLVRHQKKTLSQALKESWDFAKRTTEEIKKRYSIADWFMHKNIDKMTTAHLECHQTFSDKDIIKETEKAVYVELEMMTKSGFESRYTHKIWIPKSCVEVYYF